VFEAKLFHGEYNITVKNKSLKKPVVKGGPRKSEATIKANLVEVFIWYR
jgi:hypothetical protein